MSEPVRIVGVGNASLDVSFGAPALMRGAGKKFANRHALGGGGVASNGTVAAARLGAEAAFVGRVGDDAFGGLIIQDLMAHGVDTRAVARLPGMRSPVAAVVVAPCGDRQIISFTDAALFADANGADFHAVDRAHCVLCDLRWPAGLRAALKRARARGIPALVDFDRSPDAGVDSALALASHIVFSQPALTRLSQASSPADGLAVLRQRTNAFIGVTAGHEGAWWMEGDIVQHQPAFAIEVCDTTGAGDAFHGALAIAIAEAQPWAEAFAFAQATAALKCRQHGARTGLPTRTEVAELLLATH